MVRSREHRGQLTCEKAKEIFEGVQPEAVKVQGLTVAEDIGMNTENLKVVCPDVLHSPRYRRYHTGTGTGTECTASSDLRSCRQSRYWQGVP